MKRLLLSVLVLSVPVLVQSEVTPPAPVLPVPTQRQLDWMAMEMNAFVHFTTNTFTDREWGNGDEPETVFAPTAPDPVQWATALKGAGFKGLIFTTKHHDGFCLWPSRHTEHTIRRSPYKDGHGDMVREVADACRQLGLKFGIYLSPWDRNRADYGTPAYIEYYRAQLAELFANYGPFFEIWFDGANGGTGYYGGANENRKIDGATYYDWHNTVRLVRSLQKQEIVVFSDAGPDIRWVGNEEGRVGETNWNTITLGELYPGKPDIGALLGTGAEGGADWATAEVDVSIRPGWFYHATEDAQVKTPERLFEIYLQSVGRGAVLLLNVPPDRRGLFHENDLQALAGFRRLLDREFATDFARVAKVTVSSARGGSVRFDGAQLIDGNPDTYWATDDGVPTGTVELALPTAQTIKYVVLHEYLKLGQRVKAFTVEVKRDGAWVKVAEQTTIGQKRILALDPVKTDAVRIVITSSRACPTLAGVELF